MLLLHILPTKRPKVHPSMDQHIARSRDFSRHNSYACAFMAMWTIVVASSLWWNLAQPRLEPAAGLW